MCTSFHNHLHFYFCCQREESSGRESRWISVNVMFYSPSQSIEYWRLVYTTQVNSAFRAIWWIPQSRNIKCYSPPGGFRRKKMAREPHFIRKWNRYLGIAIKLVLYILKQLFASVSVNSDGDLPRRSDSVLKYPPLFTSTSANNR